MMKRTLLSTLIILSMQAALAEEVSEKLENLQASDLSGGRLYTFDARALFGGSSRDIDLAQFTTSSSIASGVYTLNTMVNDRTLGQLSLQFKHLDANRSAALCVDNQLLQYLDLRKEVLADLQKQECLTIKAISPEAYYDVDIANLSMQISLPLTAVNSRPAGYISPQLFDRGITTAFLGYDFNTYHSKVDGSDGTTSNFLNLNGGFNIGGFNFRHAGSYNSNNAGLGKYSSYLNTLSTDILPLKSRLTAGEFNTQTYSIDSAQIIGVQLASDLSMRPMSQQSYAPTINGFANTNALVSVFQNGRKVYERTVPAGGFEINDLTAVNNNGDLTVEVTENGGEKHSFIVPLQGNMNVIRVGQFNYSTAVGKYKFNETVSDDYISQLSLEYGLSNYVSLYGGTNLSSPFKSYLLGLGTNTRLGGFRLDAEHANATLAEKDNSGQKYQFAYQYNYVPSRTSVSFGSQYYSREYLTLGQTMSLRNIDNLSQYEIENLFHTYRMKQQYNISIYQNFKDNKYGSFYLSASKNNYWNSTDDFLQYNIGYSNSWNQLSYTFGFAQSASHLEYGTKEKKVFLTLSLPLQWGNKRAQVFSSIQHSDTYGKPTTANLGVSGTLGESNQFSYGLTNNNNWNDDTSQSSISANANYSLPQIQLGAVTGWSKEQSQYGLSARGAVVAHRYGITATNNLTDTFTVIHAEGARGANVTNAWGTKVDYFGNAIYSNVSPYEINTISLDSSDLPIDINLEANQAEVIPRRFSSTLLDFKTVKTSNILLNVRTYNGQQIPIGIRALDHQGNIVGMFGQSNQLFVDHAELLKNNISVVWGASNKNACQIYAPENQIKQTKPSKTFQIVDVECNE
mgnify:CR=1 FL=1